MSDLGEDPRRPSLFLRVYGSVIVVLVVASATQAEPEPALHGEGLLVLAALVAFLGAVVLSMLRGRTGDRRLLGLVALTALALTVLQPDGAGFLALYMTLGILCVQLPIRRAIAGFLGGVVLITLAGVVTDGIDSLSDTLVGDAIGTLFFLMAYAARSSRVGLVQAESRMAELEATRDAHAQAAALSERARLAREMHDVLAHSLSALTVQLEGARLLARARDTDPAVTAAIERGNRLARAGLEEARRAIEALRGGDMPGPERLPHLAAQFSEQTNVACDLRLDGPPHPLSSEAQLAVYRTAQEALTNVRRHARADHVDVRLRYEPEGTRLVVEDVRAGDPAGVPAGEREQGLGYGLTGMRERAELLGGRLAAAPTATGFRVELFLPEPADGR